MVRHVMKPSSKRAVAWAFFSSIVYILSYENDPYDLAYKLVPLLVPRNKNFQTVCSFVMLIDIILFFFTADLKDGATEQRSEEDKLVLEELKQRVDHSDQKLTR